MAEGGIPTLDAGAFGPWLAAMREVLRGGRDADVPCGDCIGCCISSYPIPLRPGDARARAEVPEQYLLGQSAQGQRWLMGFREDGSCPFMNERRCDIYAERPQTCRAYDCRIYAATGLLPDGNREVIERRVREWRFGFDSDGERGDAAALRRAAQFIRANAALFPPAMRAASATAAAVLAVKTYPLFLEESPLPPEALVQQVVARAREFDR